MRSFGIDSDRAIDGLIGGVIGATVGARTYYVLFHWSDYAGDWKSIFNIRNGGLAIYGGIIGALLVGSVVCKLRKVRLLPMYDLVGLGLPIGQCIGRWGNFTNHEAFGNNTDSVFGMTSGKIASWIARNYPGGELSPDQPVHPCFFYESMWCLLGFIVLHIISKKWRKFDGQIFLMYIVWYGAGRFFIEGLRTDSLYIGTVKVSQMVALLSVAVGLVLLIVGFSRVKRMGSDYVLYVDSAESKALLAEADRKAEEYAAKRAKKQDAPAEEEKTSVILAEEEPETAENADAAADEPAESTEAPAEKPSAEDSVEPSTQDGDLKG
jgi:phosphatidylglycerol:prolipoprotein diacylglycerol transferase